MTYSEIEKEADELSVVLKEKNGGREAFVAMLQAKNSLTITQQCPRCMAPIKVTAFPEGFTQGCSVRCSCGFIETDWRGL
jgi:hypothetical protein